MVEQRMDMSGWLRKQLEDAHPDLLRAMVKDVAEALMSADADAVCGAGYGERSPERVNRRNGYREGDWDTRVGSIELAVPKLREGSYFPDWLLQPRRRAEQAFVSVIADALRGFNTPVPPRKRVIPGHESEFPGFPTAGLGVSHRSLRLVIARTSLARASAIEGGWSR